MRLLPTERYSETLDWLYKFSRNTKIGYRVFALDVFSELMAQPLRQSSGVRAGFLCVCMCMCMCMAVYVCVCMYMAWPTG